MRLFMRFLFVVCVVTVILHSTSAQLFEGSRCAGGTCTLAPECLPAKEKINKFGHHNFTRCGFANFTEIVCCPFIDLRFITPTRSRKSVRACDSYTKNIPVFLNYQLLGGEDAFPGEFPHMVALGLYNTADRLYKFNCGATLISNKYVVTAAHCIVNRERDEARIVRMGVVDVPQTTEESDEVQDHKVKNVTVHPNYVRRTNVNDIALLELEKEVVFGDSIYPACLYTKEVDPDEFVIAGWGEIDRSSRRSNTLQKGIVNLVSLKECSRKYKKSYNWILTDSQLCAVDDTTDTCWGDSGGPLQLRNSKVPVLVGVTSFGESVCGSGFPSVYTRISKYLDWIEEIVWP